LIADGINVNVTLIFSIQRYREVMNAYLEGLEEGVKAGRSVVKIASVASFFVSRVDSAVDALLEEKIPYKKALLGKAAIANSKLAYREFESVFGSERFKALEKNGARKQRPLWASTGTKNRAYSDVVYVEALIGPETVDTMPPATMDAFRDHGRPASRVKEGVGDAEKALKDLEAEGIHLGEVTRKLEEAGVKSFSDSYQKILKGIEAKR
jgi:transaldolase/glucose-6-phosphate isomerase